MKKAEYSVDYAVFFQEGLPCHRTEKEIHPHGEDKNEYDKTPLSDSSFSQDKSQRIGEKQADHCADYRQYKGQNERLSMLRRGNRGHIVHCEMALPVCEAVKENHH